jgi:hypothetical protein
VFPPTTNDVSSQVIALAHSHLHFNGQPLPQGAEYLSVLMKDSVQKGYYIRVVDTKVTLTM